MRRKNSVFVTGFAYATTFIFVYSVSSVFEFARSKKSKLDSDRPELQTIVNIRHARRRESQEQFKFDLENRWHDAIAYTTMTTMTDFDDNLEDTTIATVKSFDDEFEQATSSNAITELTEEWTTTEKIRNDGPDEEPATTTEDAEHESNSSGVDYSAYGQDDLKEEVVTKFLRIVETQQELGENCTAGTDLNLGEGVVDRYGQERFRTEAEVAVNRANMLSRLWKYAGKEVMYSEYLLHSSVFSMVEFNENIFAAGNCYDKQQYRKYWLFCPYAYRLPSGSILVKDLAVEYNYLGSSNEWFFKARKSAEKVIKNNKHYSRGFHTYAWNDTAHTSRVPDEILSVTYEDGRWSKPYYDCGGGNIWMLTYTVPFFGYQNGTYFFKGTSGIDIDLRKVDIDQCPMPEGSKFLNIFAASDKCKKRTTYCQAIKGLGFRRGSYRCVCKKGFYFGNTTSIQNYFDGFVIEEEYEKLMLGEQNVYNISGYFECLPCAEGCDECIDNRPCLLRLNWYLRTAILILSCVIILCLPVVEYFTRKYSTVKVVRAASPVLLRIIVLGAFFIYSTIIIMYSVPTVVTCSLKMWFREIGFSLTYGALMLKTWRISVIFRVKSAKTVKITDADLLKKLLLIVAIFGGFLLIRTLIGTPVPRVAKTTDDLKTYLCETNWWDRWFSILEGLFLVWGIRLCIMVRKAPSEFNESRFISMAIYNEFLLSLFLNITMLFLQSSANPDLLYIICFCHTQITITLLLCFIFGSKAYMVYKGEGGRGSNGNGINMKLPPTKYMCRPTLSSGMSQTYASTSSVNVSGLMDYKTNSELNIQEEINQLCKQLTLLREKSARYGDKRLSRKLNELYQFIENAYEGEQDDEEEKEDNCNCAKNKTIIYIEKQQNNNNDNDNTKETSQNNTKQFVVEHFEKNHSLPESSSDVDISISPNGGIVLKMEAPEQTQALL